MASTSNNALEMRFRANMQDFERALRRMQANNDRATRSLADAHRRAAQQSQSSWNKSVDGIGASLKRLAPMLAGLFAGSTALQAAEQWTKFNNSLKVAGVQGVAMGQVQDALYNSAIKNGVALEPLGQLYGRAAQSAGELGASQADLLKFTDGVTSALRIQGGDMASASGALLQLSQALGAGTVRAEEFNSINEGARPILEAVARGSEKFGGSVAKLRAQVLEGKVSSQEFFQAFLAGSGSLADQASKSSLTVAASFQNIQTAFTRYIGEMDQSIGVTSRIGAAIGFMAENIDVLAKSLMIAGGVYAATFIPALGVALAATVTKTTATIANTVAAVANTGALITRTAAIHGVSRATVAATLATKALSTAMTFFGGPVGLAILGVVAALTAFGIASAKSSIEHANLTAKIAEGTARRKELEDAENKARVETDTMTTTQRQQLGVVAALTNDTNLLATAYGRLAVEAKKARLEMLSQQAVESYRTYSQARKSRQDSEEAGSGTGVAGLLLTGINAARGGQSATQRDAEARKLELEAQANHRRDLQSYNDARNEDPTSFLSTSSNTPTAPKPKAGPKPKAAKAANDRNDDMLRAAEDAYFQALMAAAESHDDRHFFNAEQIERERIAGNLAIDKALKDGEISSATADILRAKNGEVAVIKRSTIDREFEREALNRSNEIKRTENELSSESLRIEADMLEERAMGERDLRKKHAYERQALGLRQQADDALFEQSEEQLKLERLKAGYTQTEVDRLATLAKSNRNAQKRNESTQQDNQQSLEIPGSIGQQLSDYANGFAGLNTQLSNIAIGGINDLSSGLADAVMGAKSLQEAFGTMAENMIKQLIEMAARFMIFEALGLAFGYKGLGKASLGMGTAVKKNQAGTDNFSGGLSLVGENGPELVSMGKGAQVLPNNLLRNAFKGQSNSASRPGDIIVHNTVNAQDAVLTDWVRKEVHRGTHEAISQAQKQTTQKLDHRSRHALGRR